MLNRDQFERAILKVEAGKPGAHVYFHNLCDHDTSQRLKISQLESMLETKDQPERTDSAILTSGQVTAYLGYPEPAKRAITAHDQAQRDEIAKLLKEKEECWDCNIGAARQANEDLKTDVAEQKLEIKELRSAYCAVVNERNEFQDRLFNCQSQLKQEIEWRETNRELNVARLESLLADRDTTVKKLQELLRAEVEFTREAREQTMKFQQLLTKAANELFDAAIEKPAQ